jgi:uncharacterized membrane protein YecN with MAPEG domain
MDKILTELPNNILKGLSVWIVLVGVLVALIQKWKGHSIGVYKAIIDSTVIGLMATGGVALLVVLANGLKKLAGLG